MKKVKRKKFNLDQIYSYENKKEMFITIMVLISATGHVVVVSIYNYLLLLLIPYPLYPQQPLHLILDPCLMGSPELLFLKGLGH